MSGARDVRTDRRYTRDHEWAMQTDNEVLIGELSVEPSSRKARQIPQHAGCDAAQRAGLREHARLNIHRPKSTTTPARGVDEKVRSRVSRQSQKQPQRDGPMDDESIPPGRCSLLHANASTPKAIGRLPRKGHSSAHENASQHVRASGSADG